MARIAITGPVGSLEEWCAAARAAGWEAVACPLIELVPLSVEAEDLRALPAFGEPHAIVLTSSHAIPFLLELLARQPELRAAPLWVVGARTNAALGEAGLPSAVHVAFDASRLAQALRGALARESRVLWLRGDVSEELARQLRLAGLQVLDRIAYANRSLPMAGLPACEWVFFASPSAVDRWLALDERRGLGAIAIGETTLQRLRETARERFSAIIPLPQPSVEALHSCLLALARDRPS